MDKKIRKQKLNLALRQNKGKQLLSGFLNDVTCLSKLGKPISLIDLAQTDQLWATYRDRLAKCSTGSLPCFRKSWLAAEIEDVRNTTLGLAKRVPDIQMFIFRAVSEYCGAIKTTSKEILENALQLVSLDQEDLMASDEFASCGLLFEYYATRYPNQRAEEYSLLIWGEEFLKAFVD
jgi:hypothetical protein